MANTDTRWEQALLNKVTSNGERIAVIERDIKDIKDTSVKTNQSISALQGNVSNLDSRLSDIEKLIHDAKKTNEMAARWYGSSFSLFSC